MLSKKKPQDKVDPEYLVGLDTASAQPAPAGVKPFIKKYWKPIIAVQNPGTLNTTMSGTASISGVSAMSSAHFTCQYEQTITAAASGTVAALCVKEGSAVGVDTALIQLSSSFLSKQVKSASNSLRSAEISLDDSQRSMEDYTITSPISGTIIAKDVKVGDTVGSSSSTTETMCVIYDLSYPEMTLDVDELDILDIAVGQKAEITADAISDRTFEGVVTSISSAGTTTYPVTIRIDDTGSLMPGMNATAALDIPPCRRYVIVKATAGFAVFRLILKSLLFYSCLDFTQNLGKPHFCLTFGVHFSIRSLFFGIFFNVFAIGIYSFDSCFLSTAWIS